MAKDKMGGKRGGTSGKSSGSGGSPRDTELDGNPFVVAKGVLAGRRDKVLVTEKDGAYRYQAYVPEYNKAIDTSDPLYKRALRGYNVKAQFTASGEVVVTKGGLFARKRTFKTVDAFQKEVNQRLDQNIRYYDEYAELTKSGYMSQGEAEMLRHDVRNMTVSDAMRSYEKQNYSIQKESRIYAEAARDMKRRLAVAVEEAKRRGRQ